MAAPALGPEAPRAVAPRGGEGGSRGARGRRQQQRPHPVPTRNASRRPAVTRPAKVVAPNPLLSAPPRQMEHETFCCFSARTTEKKTEKKILGGLPPPAKGVGCGRGRSAEGGAAQDTHVAAMDEFGEGDVCLLPRVPRPRPRAARPRPRPAPPRPDFSRARSTSTLAAQRQ